MTDVNGAVGTAQGRPHRVLAAGAAPLEFVAVGFGPEGWPALVYAGEAIGVLGQDLRDLTQWVCDGLDPNSRPKAWELSVTPDEVVIDFTGSVFTGVNTLRVSSEAFEHLCVQLAPWHYGEHLSGFGALQSALAEMSTSA